MGLKVTPNRHEVWVRAFIQAMANYNVVKASDFDKCEVLANEAVKVYISNVKSFMKYKGDEADFGE